MARTIQEIREELGLITRKGDHELELEGELRQAQEEAGTLAGPQIPVIDSLVPAETPLSTEAELGTVVFTHDMVSPQADNSTQNAE